jgi:hypothetical protein
MHERASMTWGTWQHAHARLLIHLVLLECDTVALRACPRQHCTPGPVVRLLMENASRQQAQEECAHDDGGVGTRANLSMEVKGGRGGRTQDAHRQDVIARADPGARDLEIGLKLVSRAPPSSSQSNRSKSVAIGRRPQRGNWYDEVALKSLT